jgi:uncharacterized protein YceK
MKKMKQIIFLLILLLNGCIGTIGSRFTDNNGHVTSKINYCIGKYPYQAIYTDYKIISSTYTTTHREEVIYARTIGIISVPLDFIFDTILFIPDLFCWGLGFEKYNMKERKGRIKNLDGEWEIQNKKNI